MRRKPGEEKVWVVRSPRQNGSEHGLEIRLSQYPLENEDKTWKSRMKTRLPPPFYSPSFPQLLIANMAGCRGDYETKPQFLRRSSIGIRVTPRQRERLEA